MHELDAAVPQHDVLRNHTTDEVASHLAAGLAREQTHTEAAYALAGIAGVALLLGAAEEVWHTVAPRDPARPRGEREHTKQCLLEARMVALYI